MSIEVIPLNTYFGAEIRGFETGQPLFHEGDEADGLFIIRRGSVTVSRDIGGQEVTLAYIPAGQYVGEMGLLRDTPRTPVTPSPS